MIGYDIGLRRLWLILYNISFVPRGDYRSGRPPFKTNSEWALWIILNNKMHAEGPGPKQWHRVKSLGANPTGAVVRL